MVEPDVESVLREISERVRARPVPASNPARQTANVGDEGNGTGEFLAVSGEETDTAEALNLINSYLTTTARAWDRLPPLISNRTGTLARIELALKRYLKRATNWFTWEQVNFNAAVHQALRDTLRALSACEQELARLRLELESQRLGLKQQTETIAEVEAQRAQLEAQRAQLEAQRAQLEAQRTRLITQLGELARELRERDERLQDDQRVCFKQLSLQATESAVLEDRARRKTEALLEELKRRVEQLEARKS